MRRRRNPLDPYYEIAIRDTLVHKHGFGWPQATKAIDDNRNRLDYWQNTERLKPDDAAQRILEPMLMYYAILIDEAGYINPSAFVHDYGYAPDSVHLVAVVSPESKTYIASTQPSAEYVPIYYLVGGNIPDDVRDEMEQDLIQTEQPTDYMDWYQMKKLVDDPKTSRRLGEFESIDDAAEDAHANYPF